MCITDALCIPFCTKGNYGTERFRVRESEFVITNSRSFCKRCQVQVFLGAKPPEFLNFPPNQKAADAAVQHLQQCLISVTRKRSSPLPFPDRGSQKRSGGTQVHPDPLTFLEGPHSQDLQPQQAKCPVTPSSKTTTPRIPRGRSPGQSLRHHPIGKWRFLEFSD